MPLFTRFYQLLQCEHPLIHVLHTQMRKFLRGILSRFVSPKTIRDTGNDVTKINFNKPSNLLEHENLHWTDYKK